MTAQDPAQLRADVLRAFGVNDTDLDALDPDGSYAAARAAVDAEHAAVAEHLTPPALRCPVDGQWLQPMPRVGCSFGPDCTHCCPACGMHYTYEPD